MLSNQLVKIEVDNIQSNNQHIQFTWAFAGILIRRQKFPTE